MRGRDPADRSLSRSGPAARRAPARRRPPAIRAVAAASGSDATAMWWALACSSVARVAHDPDVALPEHEVAAARAAPAPAARSPSSAACMSESRGAVAAGGEQRDLHEPRAVDAAERCVRPRGRARRRSARRAPPSRLDRREVRAAARSRRRAAGRSRRWCRRPAPRRGRAARRRSAPATCGPRVDLAPRAPSPARRAPAAGAEPVGAHVADVAVERRLPPGEPVGPLLVDGEGLAVEELGRALGLRVRRRRSGRGAVAATRRGSPAA